MDGPLLEFAISWMTEALEDMNKVVSYVFITLTD